MNWAETAWVVDRTTLLALVPPYAVYWPAAVFARAIRYYREHWFFTTAM